MSTRPRRSKAEEDQTARYAEVFSALGNDSRLRIVRLLLAAHPKGMVVGDIQAELGIPASTLSHHLDRLRAERLLTVRREGTFLWYAADTETLEELLGFLFAECCSRNKAVSKDALVQICGIDSKRRRS
jgi:DNA-binding transcriptional ArsR family regulator